MTQAEKLPDDYFHHEDIEIGKVLTFGPYTVTADEIIAYSRKFDPQPMHIDVEAAKATPMGRLIASGYHTAALMMRIMCDGFILKSSSLGSPGIDRCRWLKPVLPGDTLSVELVATEARLLNSRPGVGLSKMTYVTRNQHGEAVMDMTSNQFMRLRRPAAAPSGPADAHSAAAEQSPRARAEAPLDLWADHPGPLPPPPVTGLYLEDRAIGETTELGSETFTREESIAFARAFDPQRFHLDEAAAAASLFGGLSASGWHTASVHVRLLIEDRQRRTALAEARGLPIAYVGPSPGFNNLKWLRPVLVGDTISFRARVVASRPLASNPKRGLLTIVTQGRNQHGQVVFSVDGQVFADRKGVA